MLKKITASFLALTSHVIFAGNFLYPEILGDSLIRDDIKEAHYTLAKHEDTLLDIARDFDIGQNEILLANPTVDRWLPGENTKVRIPNSRLLPDTPHEGVVLNLAEYRLYYYPKKTKDQPRMVITHPISIGRVDWDTPLGKTQIIAKNRNPVWRPPQSIKDEHAENGEILPDVFPAGPDNPLGLYALRLGVPGYLIHSTNKPFGVGMRVSHGCIRMYPEDIEKLFPQVKVGMPVYIVNQPIKVGWSDNSLYIEVFPDLEEDNKLSYEDRLNMALDLIEQANNNQILVLNGRALKQAIQQTKAVPVVIFKRNVLPTLKNEL
ncbi:MAG: L,D-transpeptidase family protein [Methylomarinum sp.]|nr:L,D-transpeptidase family protein [Methylomarinum sp.]